MDRNESELNIEELKKTFKEQVERHHQSVSHSSTTSKVFIPQLEVSDQFHEYEQMISAL